MADRCTIVCRRMMIDLPYGGAIAYSDDGEGRPLVLIHGWSCSRDFFRRNVGPLSERLRVIAIDLPGHGESPPRDGGHTMAQYARDVRHVLAALELEAPVLLGWSMGSFVIWDLIRQFGTQDLGGHIVVDCGPTDLRSDEWDLGVMTMPELLVDVEEIQSDWGLAAADLFLFRQEPTDQERRLLIERRHRLGANAAALSLVSQTVCDYRSLIGTYTLPTLCIWGEDDAGVRPANGRWLAERIPAELVILKNARHCSMWDQPEAFNDAVIDWIERLGRSGAAEATSCGDEGARGAEEH
jgi:non-heme chloroperoxidase